MYWRDTCALCTERIVLDALNKPHADYTRVEVYCNRKSVRQSEFYQGQAAGYRPEIMFEIRAADWNDASHIAYGTPERLYRVIRTFCKGGDTMEVVCNATNIPRSAPKEGGTVGE